MKNSGKLVSFLVPIISILLAFVIGCIIMPAERRHHPGPLHAADLHQPVRLLCIPLRRVQPGW